MSRLMNRAEMDLAGLAGSDASRFSTCGVHVTDKHSEVTNGHYLVRVPAEPMKAEDFPVVPGMGNGGSIDAIVPTGALQSAAKAVPKKSRIPVLAALHIGVGEKGIVLTSTDLESAHVQPTQVIEGKFPDCDKVIPAESECHVKVAFSAAYLKALAAYVEKHGQGRSPAMQISIDPKHPENAARIEFNLEDGQKGLAVLMPMRF